MTTEEDVAIDNLAAAIHGLFGDTPVNPVPATVSEDMQRRFTYHAPHGDQPKKYGILQALGGCLANLFVRLCPDSRERSLALTKLEEAVMWANAAIARNE